jgi:hypothetical protein
MAIYYVPSRGRFQAIVIYVSVCASDARWQRDKKVDCIQDAVPLLTLMYLNVQFRSTQFFYYKFANLMS